MPPIVYFERIYIITVIYKMKNKFFIVY
jgi:hypothetical protein